MKKKINQLTDHEKMFMAFLRIKGINRRFAENLDEIDLPPDSNSKWKILNYLFMKDRHPSVFIAQAFHWSASAQGFDFWEEVDSEWQKLLSLLNRMYK